jgi:hypothetical protein
MFPLPQTYFPTYTRTAIIYISCIAFFFIAIAALPYLKTDMSVRSSLAQVGVLHQLDC